ncbi:hypothetical protein BDE36_2220 [Arcticibacter tournemirensis]|uniref:Uncharacterized protein n=1 Tax=Arcticibacter tournemirensis TaxID=699437 RepID=A0A5M9HDK0_9SPHI|nr:hypothetical protein [Arcticibacter tournemirensis]KAA8485066.1 hypothetical protein F1649_05390 [Arcticibacter tournemirensis]TQM50474.1 hypothetical protein BDE36_2220 [Arcticibacter tournemirensis]
MIGLVTQKEGREYRIPQFAILSLISDQQRFLIEGAGYIFSSQRMKEGIEYEFLISEFEEPSEQISAPELDHEFEEALFSEENQWKHKLQLYRKLEAILKERGVLNKPNQ